MAWVTPRLTSKARSAIGLGSLRRGKLERKELVLRAEWIPDGEIHHPVGDRRVAEDPGPGDSGEQGVAHHWSTRASPTAIGVKCRQAAGRRIEHIVGHDRAPDD